MCILLSKSYHSQPWQRCLSNFCFYNSSRPSSGRTITLMAYVLESEDELSFRLTCTVVFLRTWLWFYNLEGKWWAQQQHIVSSGSAELHLTHLLSLSLFLYLNQSMAMVSAVSEDSWDERRLLFSECLSPQNLYVKIQNPKDDSIRR